MSKEDNCGSIDFRTPRSPLPYLGIPSDEAEMQVERETNLRYAGRDRKEIEDYDSVLAEHFERKNFKKLTVTLEQSRTDLERKCVL